MTVQTTTARVSYDGNGVTTVFPVPFRFLADSHLFVVRLVDGVNGVALILDSVGALGFTVAGAGAPNGGTVTTVTPPAAGTQLLILRNVPLTQLIDYQANDPFPEESAEQGIDKLTMIAQQVSDGAMQLIFDDEEGAFVWDAKGSRIVRLGTGLNLSDAVNLGQVLELIAEGSVGRIGVVPRVYTFEGDGFETDFFMDGADVVDAAMYDAYIEQSLGDRIFTGLQPTADYAVVLSGSGAFFRFAEPPGAGLVAYAILRGYARATLGPPPITTTALNVQLVSDIALLLDTTDHYSVIGTTETNSVAITIRENTGDAALDWLDGQFFSVVALASGEITIGGEAGVNLILPAGFEPKPRGTGCIVSATCLSADQGDWLLSGDLKRLAVEPSLVVLPILDRVALSGTNIVAGTGKGNFVIPFDMRLRPIANAGLYASLIVAQAAGVVFTVDVNRNGTSIITTKLTFDNSEASTLTAAVPAVYAAGGDTLAAGDVISIDVDQVGTALAKGLTVYLVGERI